MEGQTSSDILCREIQSQSRAEAETILEQAEREAAKIISGAEVQVEKITAELMQKAAQKAEGVRRRILSGVHLEVKKQKLRSRERMIERLLNQVSEKLNVFRQDKAYRNVLETWVIEGALAVDGETLTLECGAVERDILTDARLQALAEIIKKQKQQPMTLTLSEQLLDEGGVIVVNGAGRTRFDNRFSARMKRNQAELRLMIMNTTAKGV